MPAQLHAIAGCCRVIWAMARYTSQHGKESRFRTFHNENLCLLRAMLEEAGLRLAATGRCVRGIVACPETYCMHGVIDSQGLAQRLHARVGS